MILRKLLMIALLLSASLPLFAQTAMTVTSTNIPDLSGGNLANGQACFLAADNNADSISFRMPNGGQAIRRAKCVPVIAGALAISLPNVASTNPSNLCIKLTVEDTTTNEIVLDKGYECLQPSPTAYWCSGSTCNFDNFIPNTPTIAMTAAPTGVGLPSGGTQGQVLTKNSAANYDAGWITLTGGSATGADGNTISAARNPLSSDGQNGDTFVNSVTGSLWGPKASGAWPSTASYTPGSTFTWPAAIPSGTTIPWAQVTGQPSLPSLGAPSANAQAACPAAGSGSRCMTADESSCSGVVPTANVDIQCPDIATHKWLYSCNGSPLSATPCGGSTSGGSGTGNLTITPTSVLNASNIAILAMGDSTVCDDCTSGTVGVTANQNARTFPGLLSLTPALYGKVSYISNQAVSGSQTSFLGSEYGTYGGFASICHQSKLYTSIHGGTPTYDMVLLLIYSGLNDLQNGHYTYTNGNYGTFGGGTDLTAAQILPNLTSMYATAMADGCTVVAMTIADNTFDQQTIGERQQRLALNTGLRMQYAYSVSTGTYAKQYDYLFDTDGLFGAVNTQAGNFNYGGVPTNTMAGDGVHWGDAAQNVIASGLASMLVTGYAPIPMYQEKPYVGTATLASGSTTLTFFGVPFTGASDYMVIASSRTANPVHCIPATATTATCTGTGTDSFDYIAARRNF